MGRGQTAEVGATRTAPNGYHYTKTAEHGWRLTHHITAEKMLERPLKEDEIVKFRDKKFRREPYNTEGIVVIKKKTTSLRRRRAAIEDRIRELQAELEYIDKQLKDM